MMSQINRINILASIAGILLSSILFYSYWSQPFVYAIPVLHLLREEEFYLYNVTSLMLIVIPLCNMAGYSRAAKTSIVFYVFILLFAGIQSRLYLYLILMILFFSLQLLFLFSPVIKKYGIDKIKYTTIQMLLAVAAALSGGALLATMFC